MKIDSVFKFTFLCCFKVKSEKIIHQIKDLEKMKRSSQSRAKSANRFGCSSMPNMTTQCKSFCGKNMVKIEFHFYQDVMNSRHRMKRIDSSHLDYQNSMCCTNLHKISKLQLNVKLTKRFFYFLSFLLHILLFAIRDNTL